MLKWDENDNIRNEKGTDGDNGRLGTEEEKISEFEIKPIEIFQNGTQNFKKWRRKF